MVERGKQSAEIDYACMASCFRIFDLVVGDHASRLPADCPETQHYASMRRLFEVRYMLWDPKCSDQPVLGAVVPTYTTCMAAMLIPVSQTLPQDSMLTQ